MSAAIIRRLQLEIEAWRQRNYGACHPWEQLLGLCEEFGESMEAMADREAYADGIGDSAIYLLNFCTSMGWDAATLYEQRDLYEQPSRPWPILVGRIAHAYVKGYVQNYRGTREEHETRGKAAASALFATWEKLCAGMGTTFIEVLESTWAVVGKRDWTQERAVPEETDEPRVFEGALTRQHGGTWWMTKFGGFGLDDKTYADDWFEGLEDATVRITVEEIEETA